MRKEKAKTEKKKARRTYRELSWRIILLALGLWFAMSGLLTWAVAEDMYAQIKEEASDYWINANSRGYHDGTATDLPGAVEIAMLARMDSPDLYLNLDPLLPIVMPQFPANSTKLDDWIWQNEKVSHGFEAAILYYDDDGNVLMQKGDYLTFTYTTEENWNAGTPTPLGRGYIDLAQIEGGVEAFDDILASTYFQSSHLGYVYIACLRLTGYFENNEFHPVLIEEGRVGDSIHMGWDLQALNDSREHLKFNDRLTVESETNRELQTVYAWNIGGMDSEYDALSVNGKEFDGLPALLYEDSVSGNDYSRDSLWDAIVTYQFTGQEDEYGAYNYALAIRCWPLPYALLRLIPFYVVTFVIVAIGIYLIFRRIREKLTDPFEQMIASIEAGVPASPVAEWEEPRRLQQYIGDSHRELAQANVEIERLKTALDYAKSAEEHRKQLISNITHELKTPLAVIHSYAEAVQEGIDAEKKEHYLSVILDETEKMDAMVLQMLDLSRLEAGKVKLSLDTFSLPELAQSVAERFVPMMKEKQLELSWEVSEEISVIADENRIGQVITNLMSNACKYTPIGGKIHIWIYREGRLVYFRIENTAKHLSEQALEKVWESFYRENPSRTEPGTGLGLTLVKNIVELHGGRVSVRNLECSSVDREQTAVEFSFMIPS